MTTEQDRLLNRLAAALAPGAVADSAETPAARVGRALIAEEAYTHAQAEADLPAYVTDEFLGEDVARRYPELHRHLLNCPHCDELYTAILTDLVEEPAPAALPPAPLAEIGLAPPHSRPLFQDLRAAALAAAQRILATHWPALQDELRIVGRVFFQQIDRVGEDFVLQTSPGAAWGFGGGAVLLSQRVLAASYRLNQRVAAQIASGAFNRDQLRADITVLTALATQVAGEMGLTAEEQRQFSAAYQAWLRAEIEQS